MGTGKLAAENCKNGAVTLPRMNVSRYVGHRRLYIIRITPTLILTRNFVVQSDFFLAQLTVVQLACRPDDRT